MSSHKINGGNTLPNYIINLDELAMELYKVFITEDDSSVHAPRGIQKSKGLYIDMDNTINHTISWAFTEKAFITGIGFGVEEHRNIGYTDRWSLYLNDIIIIEDIFIKEVDEYKPFRQLTEIKQGDIIKIIVHNNTKIPKTVWFDIDYTVK